MKFALVVIAALLLGWSTPGAAGACTINRPAILRLQQPADAIAIGRVSGAHYTRRHAVERRPWVAQVKVERVLLGRVKGKTHPIGRSGSSAACDDGAPLPPNGELWVLYFRKHPTTGQLYQSYAYPLWLAVKSDPRLGAARR